MRNEREMNANQVGLIHENDLVSRVISAVYLQIIMFQIIYLIQCVTFGNVSAISAKLRSFVDNNVRLVVLMRFEPNEKF